MAYKQCNFFIVLETTKLKIKALADLVSWEGPLPSSHIVLFLLQLHMMEGMRAMSEIF
jgi:hypothetical protein